MSALMWSPAASNSTWLVAAAPDPCGPIETRRPCRSAICCSGSIFPNDDLQIVLVDSGDSSWRGPTGTGGGVAFGDVGECKAHVDVTRT